MSDSITKKIMDSIIKKLANSESGISLGNSRKVDKIIMPELIVSIIETRFDLQISKRTRKQQYIDARILASYFLHKYTLLSLNRIGYYVGVTDHATVIYHIKKVSCLMDVYKEYVDTVDSIDKSILNYHEIINYGNGIQALQRD